MESQSGKLERPKLTVLSLGDGIGTVANAAQWVTNWLKEDFSRYIDITVLAVEQDATAREVAKVLGGGCLRHVEPRALWEWVREEKKSPEEVDPGERADRPGGNGLQLPGHVVSKQGWARTTGGEKQDLLGWGSFVEDC